MSSNLKRRISAMPSRLYAGLVLVLACMVLCSCWQRTPSCEEIVKQRDEIRSQLGDDEAKVLSKFRGSVKKCEMASKDGAKFVYYCFECKDKGVKKYFNILDRPEGKFQRFWTQIGVPDPPKDQKAGALIVQQINPLVLDSSCPCEDKEGKKRHFAPPIR